MLKRFLKKLIPVKYHWTLYNRFRNFFGWRSKSYSSFGEDLVVSQLAGNIKNGFYVDVGAFHPFKYSNTYYLKKHFNWKGLNVEPNPENFKLFLKYRKEDINLNVGVAPVSSALDYFMFIDALYNTFDRKRKDELVSSGVELKSHKVVKVLPLAEILESHLGGQEIDFLNVDVEMLDLDVLKSINWEKIKPKVIAIEDHEMSLELYKDSKIFQFLSTLGYSLESKCHFTTIYKRR